MTKAAGPLVAAQGPFFEQLAVGQVFDTAPSVALSNGHAVTHQAIVGDRLRLPPDDRLAAAVVGQESLVHPALVWDVAIGQSTLPTHHVRANLFYRGFVFRRFPMIGDTLTTATEVVALRQNRPRPERRPTGLAVPRVSTVDQEHRPVLDFWRCAMLPLGDPAADTGHRDDLDAVGVRPGPAEFAAAVAHWRLDLFRRQVRGGEHFTDIGVGRQWKVVGADVVSSAPELARLTLNIATVHHDEIAAGGQRLVYGGHTIGLALAQVSRAIPNIVTVAGWDGCDHVGPVREGDSLASTVTVESTEPLVTGGGLAWLRVEVDARAGPAGRLRPVLLWRCAVILS
ncbi:acyl dehydratase [Amycolatopsis rubida]|nr:acyl dehydratase [Amycolatopsis rubida]